MTILTHSFEGTLDSEDTLSAKARGADLINVPCSLEEGLGRISELMLDWHPDGHTFNFFGAFRSGAEIVFEADTDGWFLVPVYAAYVSSQPKDPTDALKRRAEIEAIARAALSGGDVVAFVPP